MECKGQSDQLKTYLCELEDVPRQGREVKIDGEHPVWLMLFRRDESVLSFYNSCPHLGRTLNWGPNEFLFTPDGLLVCPHHGATFDIDREGVCNGGPCPGAWLTPVATQIEDGKVFADLPRVSTDGQ